jgi:hypothetical protein
MPEMTDDDQQAVDNKLLLAVRAIEHMCESIPKRKGEMTSTLATQVLEACHDAIAKAEHDPTDALRCLETAQGVMPLFNAPGRDAAIAELDEAIEWIKARCGSPPMDARIIRDHLSLARSAISAFHPVLAARIKTLEQNLTPGDPSWHGDAVRAETDLLAISAELEQLPKVIPPRVVSGVEGITERAQAEVPPSVNEAIRQIGKAIELL